MRKPHDFVSELVGKYGVRQRELVALTVNNDPFITGRPADIKKGTWFANTFEQLGSPREHLRDIHYGVVARGLAGLNGKPYAGTFGEWKGLLRASSYARELGLVSPFAFLDGRTRSEYAYDLDRDREDYWVSAFSPSISGGGLELPIWYPTEPSLQTPSSLSREPLVVEVWIEKESAALQREIDPVASAHGARVVIGVGFQSETAAANLVSRAIADGRPRVLLWLADADSSGESMAIATARHAEFLHRWWLREHEPDTFVPRILVDRIALTLEQVAEIEAEIGRTIPRPPDVRREEGRVELQALAAFAPGWVAQELRRRLSELTDPNLDGRLSEWSSDAKATIKEAWEAETAEVTVRLGMLSNKRDDIFSRFDLAGLRAALDELEPERKAIQDDWDKIAEEFDPDIPELPEGEVDLEGRDWLLDVKRKYEDQLNAYRRHEPVHRRRPPLVLVERSCLWCGNPIVGKRADARFCTLAHAKAYSRAN